MLPNSCTSVDPVWGAILREVAESVDARQLEMTGPQLKSIILEVRAHIGGVLEKPRVALLLVPIPEGCSRAVDVHRVLITEAAM
jgi:hypothetical protein